MNRPPLHLFEGYGIELEYMIVDRESLAVLPVADRILEAVAGEVVNEVEVGPLAWSNELVLHVIELKTNGPAPALEGLGETFTEHLRRIDAMLEPLGGRLMPTAMHPWMDPLREMRLWPHDNSPIYRAYDRIFGCRGHGWANLQSMHINLPFSGDFEFGRLHAAIRLVLPILPALAAASPIMDWGPTGLLDNRLEVYRFNQSLIPSLTGRVIPEAVFDRAAYEKEILGAAYRDISPHDPEGVLQEEWVNSRGAIARFERSAIEIRVLDVQESPRADLAIAAVVSALLQALVAGRWGDPAAQRSWEILPLEIILLKTIREGEMALIDDPAYLRLFGYPERRGTAGELWRHLVEECLSTGGKEEFRIPLETILREGPLARRILRSLGAAPRREEVRELYRSLCDCLLKGELFHG